ncbi:MAG TPA: helix-turn-helix domain-containing protein [Gaiellaceae bacterium]
MPGDVKRPYRSERRREQAAQTRERVLDAADALFRERGWEGTSIAAIAESAGVSQETVYARFGSKRALLGELMQRAVRGTDPRPVPEQSGPRALVEAADAGELLRLFAADISVRIERAAPLMAVVAAAARSEPELAELYARLHEDRHSNLKVLVDALAAKAPLRVSAAEALDTVFALTSPELNQLLVGRRGWSSRRYRDWLAESLEALLLSAGA